MGTQLRLGLRLEVYWLDHNMCSSDTRYLEKSEGDTCFFSFSKPKSHEAHRSLANATLATEGVLNVYTRCFCFLMILVNKDLPCLTGTVLNFIDLCLGEVVVHFYIVVWSFNLYLYFFNRFCCWVSLTSETYPSDTDCRPVCLLLPETDLSKNWITFFKGCS